MFSSFKPGMLRFWSINLPDRVLRPDADTTLNQSYVLFITLVTLHIRVRINISHLSIPEIVAHGKWYIPHCFYLTACRVVLVFFKCIINLISFLFKSKFISVPICDSAHLLSHYYYCYNHYFYYYLLLI